MDTCRYHDHVKWNFPWMDYKHYRARLWIGMQLRQSRKHFDTAGQAADYGRRLAGRYNRMVTSCHAG